MFDLEAQIKRWREELVRSGLNVREVLDELEGHLRKDFRAFLSAGKTEAEAFHFAVSRLGSPGSIQTEFNKLKSAHIWPVKIGSALWLGVVVALAVFLSQRLFNSPLNLIIYPHVLSVTAGYCAVLLMGGLGAYYVCVRRYGKLSPADRRSLGRAVNLFGQLAAGLVIAGVLLGMPVSKQLFGSYWRWDLKEIGALCVVGWLVALVAMRRFGRINDHAAMLMCLGGNVILMLSWFGAGIIDNERHSHSYSHNGLLALAVVLAINFGFLGLGMLPVHQEQSDGPKYV